MPQSVAGEIMHERRMPEAHLDFRRVHVHVDFLAVHIQKQQHHRKHARRRDVPVGFVDGVQQQPVPHQPPVHENINSIAIGALHFRSRRKTRHPNRRRFFVRFDRWLGDRRVNRRFRLWNLHQLFERLPSENLVHPVRQFFHRRAIQDFLRGSLQQKLPVRMRQRVMRDQRSDMPQLGRFRFQEFPPRRHRVENIGHADRSPRRHTRRFHADQFAAGKLDPNAFVILGVPRLQHQPRYRRNRGQSLAPKSQGSNGKQIIRGAQLGSRVTLESQQRVIVVHAAAVIGHPNQPLSARFRLDPNRPRPGVNRVFQQLFHHRRRPLHHLARRNLVRHVFGKYADSAHQLCPTEGGF